MAKWLIFIMIILSSTLILAQDYSDCSIYGNCQPTKQINTFNYNQSINVNNSLYWQGHTGTDGSWLTGINDSDTLQIVTNRGSTTSNHIILYDGTNYGNIGAWSGVTGGSGTDLRTVDVANGKYSSIRIGSIGEDNNLYGGFFQLFTNNDPQYPGQVYFDSGYDTNGFLDNLPAKMHFRVGAPSNIIDVMQISNDANSITEGRATINGELKQSTSSAGIYDSPTNTYAGTRFTRTTDTLGATNQQGSSNTYLAQTTSTGGTNYFAQSNNMVIQGQGDSAFFMASDNTVFIQAMDTGANIGNVWGGRDLIYLNDVTGFGNFVTIGTIDVHAIQPVISSVIIDRSGSIGTYNGLEIFSSLTYNNAVPFANNVKGIYVRKQYGITSAWDIYTEGAVSFDTGGVTTNGAGSLTATGLGSFASVNALNTADTPSYFGRSTTQVGTATNKDGVVISKYKNTNPTQILRSLYVESAYSGSTQLTQNMAGLNAFTYYTGTGGHTLSQTAGSYAVRNNATASGIIVGQAIAVRGAISPSGNANYTNPINSVIQADVDVAGTASINNVAGLRVTAFTKVAGANFNEAYSIWLEKQVNASSNYGIVLNGTGYGADIVLGNIRGNHTNIFNDKNNLVIEDSVNVTKSLISGENITSIQFNHNSTSFGLTNTTGLEFCTHRTGASCDGWCMAKIEGGIITACV